jgi:hypothetical protein
LKSGALQHFPMVNAWSTYPSRLHFASALRFDPSA